MSSLFNVVLRDSVLCCPFVPNKKNIIPEIGAALITGGASLLGNILGFGSNSSSNETNLEIAEKNAELQRETNAQNKQIADEANALNYKMFNEQNAFNMDMWNKQNEYNSPKAQVQRLLAAGINPSAGLGQAAQASSLTSAQSHPAERAQMVAPQMNARMMPYSYDFTGIAQGANAYFQNQLLNKQSQSVGLDNAAKNIDLQFKVQRTLLDMNEQIQRIDNMISSGKLSDAQRDYYVDMRRDLSNRIKLFNENFDELVKREKLQNDVLKNQADNLLADSTLKRVNADFQSMVRAYYPKMQDAQLNIMSAQFSNIIQNTENLVKEGALTSSKLASEFIQRQLNAIDLKEKDLKHKVAYGTKGTLTLKAFSDYVGGLIFDNFKLFK